MYGAAMFLFFFSSAICVVIFVFRGRGFGGGRRHSACSFRHGKDLALSGDGDGEACNTCQTELRVVVEVGQTFASATACCIYTLAIVIAFASTSRGVCSVRLG